MKFRLTHKDGVPTIEDRCAHILAMIDSIGNVVRDRESHAQYWPFAMERMFEIIGVAASYIPNEIKQTAADVDWHMIESLDRRLANPLQRMDEAELLASAARLEPLKSFATRMIA